MTDITNQPLPVKPTPPAKPLDAAVQARIDAYNALSIGEALTIAESRRGGSKKEIERLKALMLKSGVNKKTTVGEARAK